MHMYISFEKGNRQFERVIASRENGLLERYTKVISERDVVREKERPFREVVKRRKERY